MSLAVVLFCLLFEGCEIEPSEVGIREAIIRHFESRKYTVVDLRIGSIRNIPLRDKVYMGMPGHEVEVSSITLEVASDKGADYPKGKRFTFSNAVVSIREPQERKGSWVVSHVSGIPVP